MKTCVDELDLLIRLKEGDKKAFAEIYDLYSQRLYINLLKLVKSDQLAEEILQDIFILVWEKREQVDIRQSFPAYLFGIGANKVADLFRKVKRDKHLFAKIKAIATEEYSHIEESLFRKENFTILQNAIKALPPQRKQIFELCKMQGESYLEVSRKLGVSTSTINDHIVKATKSIQQYLTSNNLYCVALFFAIFY
jgi:RNA polymerase sigma-70 factor (family 1)